MKGLSLFKRIKVVSLFSGIGAFEKALDVLGIKYYLVNYCEIDKYAAKSYAMVHGCDESMNLGDITKVDTSKLPNDIDLVTYGFPCQDISLAGKQKGFEHDGERTRSGLFFEALRIIEDTKPKIAIAENVKNLVGKKFRNEFEIVLSSLEQAGYNNYWKVLNSKDYGIPQNRERVFIVSIRKDIDTGTFEFPKPFELKLRLKDMLEDEVDEKFYIKQEHIERIVKWKSFQNPLDKVAGKESVMSTITTRVAESDGGGISASAKFVCDEFENDTNVRKELLKESEPKIERVGKTKSGGQRSEIISPNGLCSCLSATDYKQPKQILEPKIIEPKPICLNSKGGRNGIDGLQPSVQDRVYSVEGISTSITTSFMPSIAEPQVIKPLKGKTENGWHFEQQVYDKEGITRTIKAGGGSGNIPKVIVNANTKKGYVEAEIGDSINLEHPNSKTRRGRVGKGVAQTLTTSCNQAVVENKCGLESKIIVGSTQKNAAINYDGVCPTLTSSMGTGGGHVTMHNYDLRIRKLTPLECWRLMGFTDEDFYKVKGISNSQLYKQAGNSIVVDVLVHLLRSVFDSLENEKSEESTKIERIEQQTIFEYL